jgi:hypothetical protein
MVTIVRGLAVCRVSHFISSPISFRSFDWVIALLLPPRQFGLKIIFGYTSIGDPDPSVVAVLADRRFDGQPLQAQTRLDISWHQAC